MTNETRQLSACAVVKRMMVRKLCLPYDVQEIVNGYCFYDRKTQETMEQTKLAKSAVHLSIQHAFVPKRNADIENYEESWLFCGKTTMSFVRQMQFMGSNCGGCGNYVYVSNDAQWNAMPPRIKCACSHNVDMLQRMPDDNMYWNNYSAYAHENASDDDDWNNYSAYAHENASDDDEDW